MRFTLVELAAGEQRRQRTPVNAGARIDLPDYDQQFPSWSCGEQYGGGAGPGHSDSSTWDNTIYLLLEK